MYSPSMVVEIELSALLKVIELVSASVRFTSKGLKSALGESSHSNPPS